MRSYIRSGVGLGVILGLAIAVGCSSSDDSSGGGAGTGGAAAGSAGKGGSGGAGTAGKGGSSATAGTGNGAAGSGEAGKGESGGDNGGVAEGGAGGESGGTGSPVETAGAAGADTGPKACNDLVFSGDSVSVAHTNSGVPTLANGAFTPGNYRLTAANYTNQGTGTVMLGSIAHVTVSGQDVTIDLAAKSGAAVTGATGTSTIHIVLATPNTMSPSSVKITCSTDPVLGSPAALNQEAKAQFAYGTTATTFTLYLVPFSLELTYTLGA